MIQSEDFHPPQRFFRLGIWDNDGESPPSSYQGTDYAYYSQGSCWATNPSKTTLHSPFAVCILGASRGIGSSIT